MLGALTRGSVLRPGGPDKVPQRKVKIVGTPEPLQRAAAKARSPSGATTIPPNR
jgi:hypothetical protein